VIVYLSIAVATVLVLRAMSRRWAAGESLERPVPYGPLDVPSATESSPPLAAPSGQCPYGPLDVPSATESSPPLAAPSGSRRE